MSRLRIHAWWVAVLLGAAPFLAQAETGCAVCNEAIKDVVVFLPDAITGTKQTVCLTCSRLPKQCYLCGMPVKKDFTELSDQRTLCARDVKTVVLDDDEALEMARETRRELDRLFSRFTSFTEQVKLRMADRVDIMDLFHVPGNDFDCPNVLGYTLRSTNQTPNVRYTISLLSALPARQLRATAAHEWAHTWIMDNVSPDRQEQLERDAREGFCELVSYLLMESRDDKAELTVIRSNAYTRGQVQLFVEAEKRFGFNEVMDWIKFGEDSSLRGEDLDRVRKVQFPSATATPTQTVSSRPVALPLPARFSDLTLQGVTWSKTRPTALINGRTLAVGDEVRVPLNDSNVLVRCVGIQPGEVSVQVNGAAPPRVLKFRRD